VTPQTVGKTAAALALAAALCACGERPGAGNAETGAAPPPPPAAGWAMGTAQGVGGRFGARDPRTCPTISTGKLTQIEAEQLLICDTEQASADGAALTLVSDLTLNLGAARRYALADKALDPDINANWLVYPVFGSFHGYACTPVTAGAPATNCTLSVHAKAVGVCYMTEHTGWHCAMADPAPAVQPNQAPPPAGA
jgi:hypothetical protein